MTLVRRYSIFVFLALILFVNQVSAQNVAPTQGIESAPVVTASVANGGIRLSAPADVLQIGLELYNANAERVFDSGAQPAICSTGGPQPSCKA